ncbi:ATP-binding protein [Streptomyces sp. NPDC058623]|uniref:ATP-binding protein n=1 Tax=Streptomyces sp. NPDC058623 TaxID=3346563 RepID=UPI003660407C
MITSHVAVNTGAEPTRHHRRAADRLVCSFAVEGHASGEPLPEADARRVGHMRRVVAALLRHLAPDSLVDTAELIVSELVTNALKHGKGEVQVSMVLTATHVRLAVSSAHPGGRPEVRAAAPDDECGRGLALVEALSDEWGTSDAGTETWALCRTSESEAE